MTVPAGVGMSDAGPSSSISRCVHRVPFGGNPVAVFPDAQGLTHVQLQQIARR